MFSFLLDPNKCWLLYNNCLALNQKKAQNMETIQEFFYSNPKIAKSRSILQTAAILSVLSWERKWTEIGKIFWYQESIIMEATKNPILSIKGQAGFIRSTEQICKGIVVFQSLNKFLNFWKLQDDQEPNEQALRLQSNAHAALGPKFTDFAGCLRQLGHHYLTQVSGSKLLFYKGKN